MDTPERIRMRIGALIGARRWAELRESVERLPAAEIADLLPHLGKPDRVLLFRALSREQ